MYDIGDLVVYGTENMLHKKFSAALSIPICEVKEYIMNSIENLETAAVGLQS